MPSMKHRSRRYYYPVDLDHIARDVARRGIDIAPTRLTWEMLARCCATMAGEQGRDAFHTMAAVWPDYSRHDSELCYNRALRQSGKAVPIGYLAKALNAHGIDINNQRYRKEDGKPRPVKTIRHPTKAMKKIEFSTLAKTQAGSQPIIGRNQLTDLLMRIFPRQAVLDAIDRYLIGFNSFKTGNLGDALIYWQVDEKNHIVNAKSIHYRFDGHRDKKVPPIVMYPDNPQCLFGLHLLPQAKPDQPVAIVESEKSALIMSIVTPKYLWMACGSMNNFNRSFLYPLRGRLIMGFPDVDINRDKPTLESVSCALWKKNAREMRLQGWRVVIDDSLEKNVNSAERLDKIDVADAALQKAMHRGPTNNPYTRGQNGQNGQTVQK